MGKAIEFSDEVTGVASETAATTTEQLGTQPGPLPVPDPGPEGFQGQAAPKALPEKRISSCDMSGCVASDWKPRASGTRERHCLICGRVMVRASGVEGE